MTGPALRASAGAVMLALLGACATAAPRAVTPTPSTTPTISPSTAPSTPSPDQAAIVVAGHDAYVSVAVATMWRSPSMPRAIDSPALTKPVGVRSWLSSMSTAQRRALGPVREDTQVLLGERVRVLAVRGAWAHVVVPAQKSPRDARGYPDWIPVRQLSGRTPPATSRVVTIVARTTMLRASDGTAVVEASYATRLPFVRRTGSYVWMWMPDGRTVRAVAADVVVADSGFPARPRTVDSIIADAKRFMGLPYLWGGTSAFGYDCSGILYSVFRTHGVLLARDSFAQAVQGRAIARNDLQPGDLVFFATNGTVHHVGLYLGDNRMLEAPRTGTSVRITSLSSEPYASEYSGARRFLP